MFRHRVFLFHDQQHIPFVGGAVGAGVGGAVGAGVGGAVGAGVGGAVGAGVGGAVGAGVGGAVGGGVGGGVGGVGGGGVGGGGVGVIVVPPDDIVIGHWPKLQCLVWVSPFACVHELPPLSGVVIVYVCVCVPGPHCLPELDTHVLQLPQLPTQSCLQGIVQCLVWVSPFACVHELPPLSGVVIV